MNTHYIKEIKHGKTNYCVNDSKLNKENAPNVQTLGRIFWQNNYREGKRAYKTHVCAVDE